MKPEVVFTKAAPKRRARRWRTSSRFGVFLRDMNDFAVFNRVFKEYMKGVRPARTTVEASPPRAGVNVEIDAIAWIPK